MKSVKFTVDTKFSTILKEKLTGKNLSQLARELKISKSLLCDWVGNRRTPSIRNIEAVAKLADYLGLSLEQLLLGREGDRKIISQVSFEDESRRYRISVERVK